MRVKKRLVRWLIVLGTFTPARFIKALSSAHKYLAIGRWLADNGFYVSSRLSSRNDIFRKIIAKIADERILYLEFGVWKGASLRWWAQHLKHADARFHGFDSFEGLPEAGGQWCKGRFSTSGILPTFDDPRVELFKGWFEETLPRYVPPPHDRLIINIDADLYSSTICALSHLTPYIRPGTIIYFDELCELNHEIKAFHDFITQTGHKFRPIAATPLFDKAAFECVG
jgi:Methyltransferase domain